MPRATSLLVLLATCSALTLTPRGPVRTRGAEACGPYVFSYAFVRQYRPEDPVKFLSGQLGILQPSYSLPFLVAAYRHLSSRPLSPGEQAAIWPTGPADAARVADERGARQWQTARRDALGLPTDRRDLETFAFVRPAGAYYLNCPDGAFETAVQTLEQRLMQFGAGSASVSEWIAAQDQVFANCGRGNDAAPAIPPELGAEAPPLARSDRAYQIAAAHFYAGHWDEARTRFRAIAVDARSPWQPWGAYLAARTLIRKGLVGGPDGQGDRTALAESAAALEGVAADPALSALHGSTMGLRRLVELRLHPDDARREVVGRLLSVSDGRAFATSLDDYQYLFRRLWRSDPSARADAGDPMSDWIDTFRADDDAAAVAHAVSRWRATGTTVWMLAALARLPPGHPDEAALLSASEAVPATSPGYPTIAFNRARLLIRAGRVTDARAVLTQMASASATWPAAAVNHVRSAQLVVASTFDEFLIAALQTPVAYGFEEYYGYLELPTQTSPTFGDDALDVLNERLPLSRLLQAADHPSLPSPIRRNLTIAVFTRALLLDDAVTVRRVAPSLRRLYPELSDELIELDRHRDADARRFAVASLLLRRPGLRPFVTGGERRGQVESDLNGIDDMRDNWWCAMSPSPVHLEKIDYFERYQPGGFARRGFRLAPMVAQLYADPATIPWPSFVSAAERRQAEAEWKTLDTVDTAPNYLGREVVRWARAHPEDARVPEALYRVVRATRYGCTDEGTGPVSREAFQLLHGRYANSEWAKKTPYWFR